MSAHPSCEGDHTTRVSPVTDTGGRRADDALNGNPATRTRGNRPKAPLSVRAGSAQPPRAARARPWRPRLTTELLQQGENQPGAGADGAPATPRAESRAAKAKTSAPPTSTWAPARAQRLLNEYGGRLVLDGTVNDGGPRTRPNLYL